MLVIKNKKTLDIAAFLAAGWLVPPADYWYFKNKIAAFDATICFAAFVAASW